MQNPLEEWETSTKARTSRFPRATGPQVADLPDNPRQFPVSAGILFGLGLGGFFDGIVLHQVLQWHHMVTSAGYPPDSVENLEFNTFRRALPHRDLHLCRSRTDRTLADRPPVAPLVVLETPRRDDADWLRCVQRH